MSLDAVTQTTLIPGSIWTRPAKKQGGEEVSVTVLFVTNSSVPAKVLEDHPQQVVFLTKKRNVQSMTLDEFVAGRSYTTMDKDAELLLESLTAEKLDLEDQEFDDIDIDSIPLPDDLRDMVGQGSVTSDSAVDATLVNVSPAFAVAPDHPLAQVLSSRFVSYSEGAERGDPQYIGNSSITLRFVLNESLTLAMLRDVFGSAGSPLEIDTFNVNSTLESTKVDFTVFVGAFLEVVATGSGGSQTLGVVQLIAEGDIRDSQAVVADTVASHGETEVLIDLSAAPMPATAAPAAQPSHVVNVNVVAAG